MIRNKRFFELKNSSEFYQKTNYWADRFSHFCSFSPSYQGYPYGTFPHVVGAGAHFILKSSESNNFDTLRNYVRENSDWLFGHFGYDLKNEIEDLTSQNPERIHFPAITFFRPLHLIHFESNGVSIETPANPKIIFNEIINIKIPDTTDHSSIQVKADCTRQQYITTVEALRKHIEEGDVYEINYCINYFANKASIKPVELFSRLIQLSPNPFSVLYKIDGKYAISASPERFLKKEGDKIISQPIKGTAARGSSEELDLTVKNELKNNEKERAENMMIVDLVRNDLAKSCIAGSVKVDEMFGIYTFPQLHQMISTVSGVLKKTTSPTGAIKNAFPMGSMTGAPKIKVMELIEKYEHSKRGLFSGSIGYFTPNNDYDFNVVIRSLFYDSHTSQLSFSVGSAITFDSEPEKEYEECLLKASAIMALI